MDGYVDNPAGPTPPPQDRTLFKVLLIVAAVVFVGLGVFAVSQKGDQVSPSPTDQTATATTTPQKTDFGTSMPPDFPTDIPIESGVQMEQSYSINSSGQKQLTIVFLSDKTVKENYSLYADFLKKQNWNISNTYESLKVSSLYGTKGNNDMNVTISENTSTTSIKSQVSISVLKKL